MEYSYPSSEVEVPVRVRAEALYLRNEDSEETTACFVTREDVVVPRGTMVRVPVDRLTASAARAIQEHMNGSCATNLDFQLKNRSFLGAVQKIRAIIEEDDLRKLLLRQQAASAKVRRVR